MGDDIELIGNKKIEDNPFIQVIRRARGMRINYNMIHPQDKNKKKLFKFYLSNDDYEQMSSLIKSHRDILIFLDGSSRGNPGRAGAGISFFGRKIKEAIPVHEQVSDIIDITEDTGSDNIFDILANEKKMEIMRESTVRAQKRAQVMTNSDELEERQFMFGA